MIKMKLGGGKGGLANVLVDFSISMLYAKA